jgi:hypothetical protein
MPTSRAPFLTMREVFADSFPDPRDGHALLDGDLVEQAQVYLHTYLTLYSRRVAEADRSLSQAGMLLIL